VDIAVDNVGGALVNRARRRRIRQLFGRTKPSYFDIDFGNILVLNVTSDFEFEAYANAAGRVLGLFQISA
jgi:hypothetical protein